jgi:hypothetical protein
MPALTTSKEVETVVRKVLGQEGYTTSAERGIGETRLAKVNSRRKLRRHGPGPTSLDRLTTLASKGWLPSAQLNQAKRDGLVAEKLEAAAQRRLEAVGIELAAAQRGVFVGSSNNDRPRYMQRTDQLEQEVSNLAEALDERDQRMSQ